MIGMGYGDNVFINCPYDIKYKGLMEAIIFVVVVLGFNPRLSLETSDSGENRIDKIVKLIKDSKYSIHDLSRMVSSKPGEYFRLNMPLELGIDLGCRKLLGSQFGDKRFLILEEEKYRFKEALSDLSGVDIKAHDGRSDMIIRCVRNWFSETVGLRSVPSPEKINEDFTEDFQTFFLAKAKELGYTETNYLADIPTVEYIDYIKEWRKTKKLYYNIIPIKCEPQEINDTIIA